MKLSDALGLIKGSEKTASDAAPSRAAATSSSDANERLKQALKEATASSSPTKTAAHTSPVEDLEKIAADISRAEHEALAKEAQLYGAAVCDGFMARAAQYKEAAAVHSAPSLAKTASDASFEKFASENPALVKEAAEIGYAATIKQLEKVAEDAYAKGWNDTVTAIHKTACDSFVSGFHTTMTLLENRR